MTYYDEISEGYEELHKEEQEKKVKLIKENLHINREDTLLDVGCGTGITTCSWDCDKTGIDPAEKLIEKARKKEGVYIIGQAENLPFEENSFTIVISVTAIQNFEDIMKGLEEIKRVGKDRFVLTFLKKSAKREMIEGLIEEIFDVEKIIEEDKDILYFCKKYIKEEE